MDTKSPPIPSSFLDARKRKNNLASARQLPLPDLALPDLTLTNMASHSRLLVEYGYLTMLKRDSLVGVVTAELSRVTLA